MALEDVPRLIPIGEFARLGGVSVKALRLYARIGLLSPARVRPQSGYRLYDASQFATLHRILLLKQAGLALADIGDQWPHADEPALTTIRESLLARAEHIRQQLSWVEAELRALQLGGSSATPAVVIKTVPTMNVLSMRRNIDSYAHADSMLDDLGRQTPGAARLVAGAIWHDCGQRTKTIDCEAFWVCHRGPRSKGLRELAPVRVASAVHQGDESSIPGTYEFARRWIAGHGFKISGPTRELYLGSDGAAGESLIEIQFPIAN